MRLEELFEEDIKVGLDATKGGGYPSKQEKDKTKLVSKLLRRKSDKNNPDRADRKGPDVNYDNTNMDPDGEKGHGLGPSGTGIGD